MAGILSWLGRRLNRMIGNSRINLLDSWLNWCRLGGSIEYILKRFKGDLVIKFYNLKNTDPITPLDD